ncbi:MAG: LamG domain-containing protein, partial [Deltaproteobacteria bacterium]|nr:LamG domain-containing protein [Deltaproteobacteria bacterium]
MKKQILTLILITICMLALDIVVCAGARVTNDQVALYSFKEGSGTTVNDVSGVGAPLNLTVASEAAISWIPGGGLSVDSSTLIESGVAATKVIDAVKASNEITIEAWIKPANNTQEGPARIFTLSSNTSYRNFTLGQQTNTYDVRFRTTSTSLNGIPSVTTPAGTLTTDLTHLVYTRAASGEIKIYIDGNEISNGNVGGDSSNWDNSYHMALANELTNDRTWLGEFYLVAIFDRTLTEPEIDQNFATGHIVECTADGDCDDSNLCTDDTCVDYECQNTNNTSACDDGLFCNGNDTCSGGSCSIHAGNPCPETECNTCQEDIDSCFDPLGAACTDDG